MFGVYTNSGLATKDQFFTDRMLTGTKHNPDISYLFVDKKNKARKADDTQVVKLLSMWNISDYTPGVSTLSGASRSLIALLHMVIHASVGVFAKGNRKPHFKEVARGVDHFFRGAIAAVPLAGNAITWSFDMTRGFILKRKLTKEANTKKYDDKIMIFGKCGPITSKNFDLALKTQVLDYAYRINGLSITKTAIDYKQFAAPSA